MPSIGFARSRASNSSRPRGRRVRCRGYPSCGDRIDLHRADGTARTGLRNACSDSKLGTKSTWRTVMKLWDADSMNGDVDTIYQVAGGVLALCAVALLVRGWRRASKVEAALDGTPSNSSCVACQSVAIDRLAKGCYRCKACGFTWGKGLREQVRVQRNEALARMTDEQRKAVAVEELSHAQAALEAALAFATNAANTDPRGRYTYDGDAIWVGEDTRAIVVHEQVLAASGAFTRAQRHLVAAADASGARVIGDCRPLDLGLRDLASALHWDADNADTQEAIDEIRAPAERALLAVRQLTARSDTLA